jgi:hypothetical protein
MKKLLIIWLLFGIINSKAEVTINATDSIEWIVATSHDTCVLLPFALSKGNSITLYYDDTTKLKGLVFMQASCEEACNYWMQINDIKLTTWEEVIKFNKKRNE